MAVRPIAAPPRAVATPTATRAGRIDQAVPFVDIRCRAEELHTGITEGTGSKCCIDVFLEECKCGPSDMGRDDENVVPRCEAAVMRCISGRTLVASCSE